MYIPAQFMIDEHNRRLADYAGRPAGERRAVSVVRRRVSGVLRAVADRLDPACAHTRGVKLVVMPYPGDARTMATRMEARK